MTKAAATRTNLFIASFLFVFLTTTTRDSSASQIVNSLPSSQAISTVGGGDSYQPITTPDGRFVLFASTANNLAAVTGGETPSIVTPKLNVFLRDRQAGTTALVSVNPAGTVGGNGDSYPCAISTNGRYALFESAASNLVAGDTNEVRDIFLRDMVAGVTAMVSVTTNGSPGNGESHGASMTPDGLYVAFVSAANNLVPGDVNGIRDIFVRNMQTGTTVLASPGANAVAVTTTLVPPLTGASSSENPILSADGRYVAFYSTATNLVLGSPTYGEIYVRDLLMGVTLWASTNAHLLAVSNISANFAMSTNGLYVAYESSSVNLGGVVFRYHVGTGVTDTIATNGAVPAYLDWYGRNIDISADGTHVAFTMTNGSSSLFGSQVALWNAQSNTLTVVSGATNGSRCDFPRIDQSGRYVAFFDNDSTLTTNSDGKFHLYVRDTQAGTVQMVDVETNGTTPISYAALPVFLSGNGQLAAFACYDGAVGPSPFSLNVFARDLASNTTEVISAPVPALASVTPFGQSGLASFSVSSNGQFVAYDEDGPGITNGVRNVYVHDFNSRSNVLVSVGTDGVSGGSSSSVDAAMSSDGRYVAFVSCASNLVANYTNTASDIFVRDTQANTTTLASVSYSVPGQGGNADSRSPQLSSNGQYLLFYSRAANLVKGAAIAYYWRDLQANVTYAVGTNAAEMTPDGNVVVAVGGQIRLWQAQTASSKIIATAPATVEYVAISPDGTRLAYAAGGIYVTNLTQLTGLDLGTARVMSSQPLVQFSADGNYVASLVEDQFGTNQVYLYDFENGEPTLVSQSYYFPGFGGNGDCDSLAISQDGRFVAFRSYASDLVPGDTNNQPDIFLFDRIADTTTLVSVSQYGNWSANGRSYNPVFSGDGGTLLFTSWASDLAPGDFNQSRDVFALPLLGGELGGSTNGAPPLELTGLALAGTNGQFTGVTLTWQSTPGNSYQVQYTGDLSDPQWQVLGGWATVVGSQGQITDPSPDPGQRFYRIVSY